MSGFDNAIAAMAAQKPQPMPLTMPMNDTQVVALVAGQRQDLAPREAVAWAIEAIAEAIIQMRNFDSVIARKEREASIKRLEH